jgi:2-amino-4-hydroxy-6-hydroxymethyldihydropteridine diphosphokinase
MVYYVSLGSNLGERQSNLEQAISFLKGKGTILKVSAVYETNPVSMALGSRYFLNQVVCLECLDSPPDLLHSIKEFERSMGRDIGDSHRKNRAIDIDILLADRLIYRSEELTIPHREMAHRAFVLIPLAEIAAHLRHPELHQTIKEILDNLTTAETVKRITG